MKAAPMPKLGRLWGPFYRLCRPGGPRIVIHFHKWSEVRHDVDDGGQIINSYRYCAGCATQRGLPMRLRTSARNRSVAPMGRSRLGNAPFPGWARLRTDLADCAAGGDELKLTAVEAMVVLGEVDRLNARLDWAARILRGVAAGNGCWAVRQGHDVCERQGVGEFVAGVPRRRSRWLWRR